MNVINDYGGALNSGLSWRELALMGIGATAIFAGIGGFKLGCKKHSDIQAMYRLEQRKQEQMEGGLGALMNDPRAMAQLQAQQQQQQQQRRAQMPRGNDRNGPSQEEIVEVFKVSLEKGARLRSLGHMEEALEHFLFAYQIARKGPLADHRFPVLELALECMIATGDYRRAYELSNQEYSTDNFPTFEKYFEFKLQLSFYLLSAKDPRTLDHLEELEELIADRPNSDLLLARINSKLYIVIDLLL